MEFVNSVQMNLCLLNTFFLTVRTAANRPKSEEKSVQLAEVHLYQSYFLQNPYFSSLIIEYFKMKKQVLECF